MSDTIPKRIYKRRGDFIIGAIFAALLFLLTLNQYFSLRNAFDSQIEERMALEQLGQVAQGVQSYVKKNRKKLLDLPGLALAEGQQSVSMNVTTAFSNAEFSQNMPFGTQFSQIRNIWGDRYVVVLKRDRATSGNSDEDRLSACVIATGGTMKRHTAGTDQGERWLGEGMRHAVLRGGPSFGFVETTGSVQALKSTTLYMSDGIQASGADDGDLGYLVAFALDDTAAGHGLQRYRMGYTENGTFVPDNEPNTMHADIDVNDRNLLQVKQVTAEAIDTANMKIDTTLFTSEQEAEDSCRNNWIYIRDQNNAKHIVDSQGNVYAGTTMASEIIGTNGMNGEREAITNEGRLYYISPTEIKTAGNGTTYDSSRGGESYVSSVAQSLAICRTIDGVQTLAYIGDNRSQNTVAFVLSAVDGDFIPPFFCPGQDADVKGGGTLPAFGGGYRLTGETSPGFATSSPAQSDIYSSGRNTDNWQNGIRPMIYVIPQIVSSGPAAYPIQGIRAYAETQGNRQGWIIRLNALVDKQKDGSYSSSTRSFWTGNYPTSPADSGSVSGYTTLKQLDIDTAGAATASNAEYISYLRAVVIGICSGKNQTF